MPVKKTQHLEKKRRTVSDVYMPVVPLEAVPEVSKGKVYINRKKNVPIGIDGDLLNTFHSISHATLFWWWIERRSNKNYSVLQSATIYESLLLTSTKNYFGTTPCYKSTTPALQSTTPALQSTTPYYKILLRTTKYYPTTTNYHSSTTPNYTVLLQYYSVLQSTTPVLQSTNQYYKVHSSTTLYYK